jgi:hypothetical protein
MEKVAGAPGWRARFSFREPRTELWHLVCCKRATAGDV